MRASFLLVVSLASGCYLSHERPRDAGPDSAPEEDAGPDGAGLDGGLDAGLDGGLDAGTDAGWDAGPEDCDGGFEPGRVSDVDVDLLFVVDNSGSMADEQLNLTSNFPRMVTALGSGDIDEDGVEDFPPVRNLRVAVVTTDLGIGTRRTTCEDADGEDGVFRTRPGYSRSCDASYPRFLLFSPGGDLDSFADDFHCLGRVGTSGCGIEQPLEAALKALTPASAETRFTFGSSTGHGDGANAGFLRPDSILAILFVTDEDDCSFHDRDLWRMDSVRYSGDLRCHDYEAEALHSVERFVEGLGALRPDPDRLVVGAITGVPEDLVEDPESVDYDAILADDRMQKRPNPLLPGQLLASCSRPRVGAAEPPVRIVQTLRGLGRSSVVQSICSESFEGALIAITSRLGRAIRRIECRMEGRT